jgi:hypothetical protein
MLVSGSGEAIAFPTVCCCPTVGGPAETPLFTDEVTSRVAFESRRTGSPDCNVIDPGL